MKEFYVYWESDFGLEEFVCIATSAQEAVRKLRESDPSADGAILEIDEYDEAAVPVETC